MEPEYSNGGENDDIKNLHTKLKSKPFDFNQSSVGMYELLLCNQLYSSTFFCTSQIIVVLVLILATRETFFLGKKYQFTSYSL